MGTEEVKQSYALDVKGIKKRFNTEPDTNVISQEEFQDRVRKVFEALHVSLARSFGPYGSSTIIINYPFHHATKDGFTIMKNLSFNASETLLDQSIADMAADICGRLNNTVGDGTTSAIIATNSIYQSYIKHKNILESEYAMPRDIIKRFNNIKDDIIERLSSKVKGIQSSDPDELEKNIKDVVFISSNGDKVLTDYIGTLYRELMGPGIICNKAEDGETKMKLIDGYSFELHLTEKKLYFNDEDVMHLKETDIIVFSCKVGREIFDKLILPLNVESQRRHRHLIVAAPMYDSVTMDQYIGPMLRAEKVKTKDINLVLTTYRANSDRARKLVEDFAIMINTKTINRELASKMIADLEDKENPQPIYRVFNIDSRNIEGASCIAFSNVTSEKQQIAVFNDTETDRKRLEEFKYSRLTIPEDYIDKSVRVGYVRAADLTLTNAVFTGEMVYDEILYDAAVADAKNDLEEKTRKYAKLGTFNIEVAEAQARVYSLKKKMGIIEIGGDSELSQKLLKDQADDAIKAATSSFNNGVLLGGNVNMLQVIEDMLNESLAEHKSSVKSILLEILYKGYRDVYAAVFYNAFSDMIYDTVVDAAECNDNGCNEAEVINLVTDGLEPFVRVIGKMTDDPKVDVISIFPEFYDTVTIIDMVEELGEGGDPITLFDVIAWYSTKFSVVFDLSSMRFSNTVVNSAETDIQILRATIDLVSLLMTGNQTIVTQRHNFAD